jgi:hypothetical protein
MIAKREAKSDTPKILAGVNAWATLWPLLLPVILLIPGLNAFPYPPAGDYSDLMISHFPNLLYLRRTLLETGVVPLWSPTILSGYPFGADPLSGLWYPPGWLALILPAHLGFNLLIAAHMIFGGLGMYYLLKNLGLSHTAALFGGLGFETMPKIFAHYGAGHLTLVYALAWTPWLLYAASRRRHKGSRVDLLPGLILGLAFLADPRWAAFAGILWWAYTISYSQTRDEPVYLVKRFLASLKKLLPQTALAVLIACPLGLPLLEYTQLSTRVAIDSRDILTYSLPPVRLLGLIFPDYGGFHEWMLYPGAFVLILAVIGLVSVTNKEPYYFWGLVSIIALIFSMGEHVPGLSALAYIPGLNLLRVPSRALLIVGFALLVLAAMTLDRLFQHSAGLEIRKMRLAATALGIFPACIFIGMWLGIGYLDAAYLWAAMVYAAGATWVWLALGNPQRSSGQKKRCEALFVVALFALSLLDWGLMDRSLFTMQPGEVVLREQSSVAKYLSEQPGRWRVYSPSYSMPQQTAALYGLELSDGVDPLQLKSYVDYMRRATGIPMNGYSVTMPPYENGNPEQANQQFHPVPELLGRLNVKYVVSEYDLNVDGLLLVDKIGATRIYRNTLAYPRAWVQNGSGVVGEAVIPAQIQVWSPNQLVLSATGPGELVLSEIDYPGWRVWVDGVKSEVDVFDGLFRGVRLQDGVHDIVFRYRPISVYTGLVLGVLGLIIFSIWQYWAFLEGSLS